MNGAKHVLRCSVCLVLTHRFITCIIPTLLQTLLQGKSTASQVRILLKGCFTYTMVLEC
jgi:hypothetical protein